MSNHKAKIKIILRIRNPREEDIKKAKQTMQSKQEDRKTTYQTLKKLSNSKSKTLKSPKNEIIKLKTSVLNENAKYTIFTSIEKSNICVVSNNPISGKLIQDTFHTSSEIYDYSVNLINNSSILEYDEVYNEQYKYNKNKN